MSKNGKTVEFRRRGNGFMLPIMMNLDIMDCKELCPLDGQHDDDEHEQDEMEHGDEFVNLGGEAPSMPSAKAAKEAAPPTEEEVKTHELTHSCFHAALQLFVFVRRPSSVLMLRGVRLLAVFPGSCSFVLGEGTQRPGGPGNPGAREGLAKGGGLRPPPF